MSLSPRYRTALVTGAGSGLGAAIVARLAREGVTVWGTARDATRLRDRADLRAVALELGDAASIDAAWARAEEESGGIDLLINNAGSAVFGPFRDLDAGDWERQIAVLLNGPARLARLAFQAMSARNRGCIVNVSSLAVDFPIPFLAAYDAAKAGLSALSDSLDLETHGSPVSVIDFRPGDLRTDFNQNMLAVSPSIEPTTRAGRVWARLQSLRAGAPAPEAAACDLCRALERGRRGTVRSGGFFQAVVAPFLARFGSDRLTARVQRGYFRID